MASGSSAGITLDVSFGLDDPNFSDRTLLLEIIDEAHSDDDRLWKVKRRRSDDLLNAPPERLKTIHVNSLILAARSPFFHKLFSNGMQESEQKQVKLKIEALEEASFMELLTYMYSNNLPATLDALLDLCLSADKFEVASCLIDCVRALQKMPMTSESASVYLDLPPCLIVSPTVQQLIEAAKKFLVAKFEDLSAFEEELLNLPLLGLQAILSSDDLHVTSEIKVFNFVLEWVAKHYPDLKKRRYILKEHLLHLVRFPFMTTTELTEKVKTCSDIDPEHSSEIVIRALCFKAETNSHRKHCLAAEEGNTSSHQYVERSYIYRQIKVVELELPHPQCVVYLDLTRNELKRIFPKKHIWSEIFHLDGRKLKLCVQCSSDQLYLWLIQDKYSACTVKYVFAVRRKPQLSFESWFTGSHTFTDKEYYKKLHGGKWTDFIGDDSSYFINDIFHLRVELSTVEK